MSRPTLFWGPVEVVARRIGHTYVLRLRPGGLDDRADEAAVALAEWLMDVEEDVARRIEGAA